MKKKFYLLMIIATVTAAHSFAQNVAINEDGSAPNPNAILDVKSLTKGVLIPRVSTTGRLAMPNTVGLLVYDTVSKSFWFNNGTVWQNIASGTTAGSAWLTNGNTGTTSDNFLGSIDSVPLQFRVNNQFSGQINPRTGNTFFGYKSGLSDTSTTIFGELLSVGTQNTAVGYHALFADEEGSFNTAIGFNALRVNQAAGNTALGSAALQANTEGNGNTGLGTQALTSNTTGFFNTAVGATALARTNANYNTAVGTSALNQSTGANNTLLVPTPWCEHPAASRIR